MLSFLFIIARYTESVSKEFATFTITIFIVKKLLSVLFFSMKSVSQWIISIAGRSITEQGVDRRAARWQLSWRSRWSATSWTRLKVSVSSEMGFQIIAPVGGVPENFPSRNFHEQLPITAHRVFAERSLFNRFSKAVLEPIR